MTKFADHRTAINATLKSQGKTRYWLAKRAAEKMSMSQLYGYLSGDRELTSDKLQTINEILGLRFTDE